MATFRQSGILVFTYGILILFSMITSGYGTIYRISTASDSVGLNGKISLREAVGAANDNMQVFDAPAGSSTGKDIIQFDEEALLLENGGIIPIVIPLSLGDMAIDEDIEIQGLGRDKLVIDTVGYSFQTLVGTVVTLEVKDLTIKNGVVPVYLHYSGAVLSVDGCRFISNSIAIMRNGNIQLINSEFIDNDGIVEADALQADNCVFLRNRGANTAGAVYSDSVSINNCVFAENSGTSGGAVYVTYGPCVIKNSRFVGNSASRDGGAVKVLAHYSRSVQFQSCLMIANYASDNGGAIDIGTLNSGCSSCAGSASIENCALVGNKAKNGDGGAIYGNSDSEIYLRNSTIANNEVKGFLDGAAISFHTLIDLRNCVIARNYEGCCLPSSSIVKWSYYGEGYVRNSLVQGGYNGTWNYSSHVLSSWPGFANPLRYSEMNEGADGSWGTEDDVLGDWRVQTGSPVIDQGNNAYVPVGVTTDLALADRICNSTVDMGAYEYQVINADTDGDGIVDAWEEFFFASMTNCLADADSDGDGQDNLSEYLADTNPTNPASFFCFGGFGRSGAGFQATWPASTGRVYTIDWRESLVEGTWAYFTNFHGTNINTDLLHSGTPTSGFYRVRVGLE